MSAPAEAREPGLQADAGRVAGGWLRIGIATVVAAQAMVFSLAVNLTPPTGVGYLVAHGGLILAALLTLGFLGGDLMRTAWAALRARQISIDLLFLVTLLGALVGSLVSTFTRTGAVYYEVVAVLIVVHTTGKLIGARSRQAALRATDRTRATFATCVVLAPDGTRREVPAVEVPAGARVLIAPGAAIAVDGAIERGRSFIQETAMTGEWRPVARGPGAAVLAGTYALDGELLVRASGGRRRLDAMLAAVAAARLAPSELQRQADRLMRWFLPLVLGVSAVTFFGWWQRASWDEALFNAMAVLLVACPCAMGLATPIAVWNGLARLARLGLVARTGDVLDVLARADVVIFDKTGTLSADAITVSAVRGGVSSGAVPTPVELVPLVALVMALERDLPHPVARALVAWAEAAGCGAAGAGGRGAVEVEARRVVAGAGVEAECRRGDGSVRVRLGAPDWATAMAEVRASGPTAGALERELLVAAGAGPVAPAAAAEEARCVVLTIDGVVQAEFLLAEAWRPGWREALRELRALGIEPEVLSGDAQAAAVLADLVDVPVRGGLSPEDKAWRVEELRAQGRVVLFVGDGVNDALAMSGAAGAIAMGGGADLARAAAGAVLAGDDLRFLPAAVRLAREVRGSIRSNLALAVSYNVLGMIFAALGWLHPVVAALLMVGSSAAVSWRALRSGRAVGPTVPGWDPTATFPASPADESPAADTKNPHG